MIGKVDAMSKEDVNILIKHIIMSSQPDSDPKLRFRFVGQLAYHSTPNIGTAPSPAPAAETAPKESSKAAGKKSRPIIISDADADGMDVDVAATLPPLRKIRRKSVRMDADDDAARDDDDELDEPYVHDDSSDHDEANPIAASRRRSPPFQGADEEADVQKMLSSVSSASGSRTLTSSSFRFTGSATRSPHATRSVLFSNFVGFF